MVWLGLYFGMGLGFSLLDRRNIVESVREVIFEQDANPTMWSLLPWLILTSLIEISFWPAIVASIVARSVLK